MDDARKLAARARAKRWADENPEQYRANQKRWREQNKAKTKAYNAEYREENREHLSKMAAERYHTGIHQKRYANPEYAQKCKDRAKEWREKNPEEYAAKNREWRAANPEAFKAIQRAGWINRRAKMRAAGKISAADIRVVRGRKKCAACGLLHPKMEIDHMIALSRGGTNHLSNLQLLCQPCNRSKHAKDPIAWAQENGRLL